MDQHHVRLLLLKDPVQAQQYRRGLLRQRKPLLHDVQIHVRLNAEKLQDLVQELPVLRRNAHTAFKTPVAAQCQGEGRHFDRFGTGPEYRHYLHTPSTSILSPASFAISWASSSG